MFRVNYLDWEKSKSMILTFTVFHLPTQYYTNVNAVFELTGANYVTAGILAAKSFKTPLQQGDKELIFYIVARFLLVTCLIVVVAQKILRKRSIREALSLSTLTETSLIIAIIGAQLYSLVMLIVQSR